MILVRRVIELMLLRRGPQDMPGDQTTLLAAASVYCSLLFLQVALVAPVFNAALQALLATALLALYVHTILRLRQLGNRFLQTATALFACGSILTLIMLAPTHAMASYLQAISTADQPRNVALPPGFVMLAYVTMGIWGLAIHSHIYRHALDVSIWLGAATAVAFEIFLLLVFSVLG